MLTVCNTQLHEKEEKDNKTRKTKFASRQNPITMCEISYLKGTLLKLSIFISIFFFNYFYIKWVTFKEQKNGSEFEGGSPQERTQRASKEFKTHN